MTIISESSQTDNLRQCTKCHEFKPATTEFFAPSKGNKIGLRPECRVCMTERRRQHYEANREKVCEAVRQYRMANPDKLRERNRRYCRENPEKVRAGRLRRYHANIERERERNRRKYRANPAKNREQSYRWLDAHPEKRQEYAHRYRARKRQAEGEHTAEDILAQYKSQKGKCWWCGKKIKGKYEVDHRIPLARGGSDAPENLVIACQFCNRSKGARLPHEWSDRLL